MDAWSAQSSLSQREDDKSAQQGKIPIIQIENEVNLTIQGQRAVQDIVDKALELFRRLQNFKLSSETTASTRQSQMQSREIRETLNTIKALFAKLRKTHEEAKARFSLKPGQSVEVYWHVYCTFHILNF